MNITTEKGLYLSLLSEGMTAKAAEKFLGEMKLRLPKDVSNWRIDAQADGLLEVVVNPRWFKAEQRVEADETIHRTKYKLVEAALQALSGGTFIEFRACYSGAHGGNPETEQWPRPIKLFARNAAPQLVAAFNAATVFTVGWGKTLWAVINAMGTITGGAPVPVKPGAVIFPFAGHPMRRDAQGSDSTAIARILAGKLNSRHPVPSLEAIPSTEPSTAQQQRFRNTAEYRQIFGDSPADANSLMGQAEAVITGVGDFHNGLVWRTEIAQRGLGPWAQARCAYSGDLGGALMPVTEEDFDDPAWLGITLKHFKAIASRNSPGVILVVLGRNKMKATLRAVQLKMVNKIIADYTLADALHHHFVSSDKMAV
jgi:DNA-binding transcriptional regulator LsrR (DeoR family)